MAAVTHGGAGAVGKHVYKLTAAQRFHDDDGDALGSGGLEAVDARLRYLIEVIVLYLAEVPVIVIKNLKEIVSVTVIGETNVSDGSFRFLLPYPVKDTYILKLLPHGDIGKMVHEVVVDVVGAKAGQFFVEVSVEACAVAD